MTWLRCADALLCWLRHTDLSAQVEAIIARLGNQRHPPNADGTSLNVESNQFLMPMIARPRASFPGNALG